MTKRNCHDEHDQETTVEALDLLVEDEMKRKSCKPQALSGMALFTPMGHDDYHQNGRLVQSGEDWLEHSQRVFKQTENNFPRLK